MDLTHCELQSSRGAHVDTRVTSNAKQTLFTHLCGLLHICKTTTLRCALCWLQQGLRRLGSLMLSDGIRGPPFSLSAGMCV